MSLRAIVNLIDPAAGTLSVSARSEPPSGAAEEIHPGTGPAPRDELGPTMRDEPGPTMRDEPGPTPRLLNAPVPGENPGPWLVETIDRAIAEVNSIARWSYRQDRHRGTRDAIGITSVESVACHLGCLLGTTKALFSIVGGLVPEEIESKITLSPVLTQEEGTSRIRKPMPEASTPVPDSRPAPADWKVEADRARIVWRHWIPARRTKLRQRTNRLMDEGVNYPECEVRAYREILDEKEAVR